MRVVLRIFRARDGVDVLVARDVMSVYSPRRTYGVQLGMSAMGHKRTSRFKRVSCRVVRSVALKTTPSLFFPSHVSVETYSRSGSRSLLHASRRQGAGTLNSRRPVEPLKR